MASPGISRFEGRLQSLVGAVLVSGVVGEALGDDYGFPMGYTYNGHPTAWAVGLENLAIIEREMPARPGPRHRLLPA